MSNAIRHERDYIERTIATVRIHGGADNSWPQWANIFADEIEACWAELAAARKHLRTTQVALKATRERERLLTEALRQIRDYEWHPGQPPTPDVRGIARAALDAAGEQDEGKYGDWRDRCSGTGGNYGE